jgi:hypothetical protein
MDAHITLSGWQGTLVPDLAVAYLRSYVPHSILNSLITLALAHWISAPCTALHRHAEPHAFTRIVTSSLTKGDSC